MKVLRLKSGVLLAESNSHGNPTSDAIDTGMTLQDFMQLPCSFWLLDKEGCTKVMNAEGLTVCGFQSEQDAIGNSLMHVSSKHSALQLLDNCQKVITTNTLQIFDEYNIRKDGIEQQFLSIKLPWLDVNHNIVGIFGFSIVLGLHSLSYNLSFLSRLGIFTETQPSLPNLHTLLNNTSIPPREQQCLRFIVQGYTAKMIAKELGLSFRTIESYIINLKTRLGVNTKTELIKTITDKLPQFI